MKTLRDKFWMWGYTLDKVPEQVPFVTGPVHCSLETAAAYLGLDHVMMLNAIKTMDLQADSKPVPNHNGLKHLADCREIICALSQNSNWVVETARMISELSLEYPNITGAIIDDFLIGVSDQITPAVLKEVYEALKSKNPELKLYIVRYAHDNHDILEDYKDYFDGINLWVWVSTESFWRSEYFAYIQRLKKQFKDKELIQGIFLHNYGETWYTNEDPISPEMLELSCMKSFPNVRGDALNGIVFLQNGWFTYPNHKATVLKLKECLDWFLGTSTSRN